MAKNKDTHPIQQKLHIPMRVHGRVFAAELRDFAEQAHCLSCELLKVFGVDARGCFGQGAHGAFPG